MKDWIVEHPKIAVLIICFIIFGFVKIKYYWCSGTWYIAEGNIESIKKIDELCGEVPYKIKNEKAVDITCEFDLIEKTGHFQKYAKDGDKNGGYSFNWKTERKNNIIIIPEDEETPIRLNMIDNNTFEIIIDSENKIVFKR